MNRQGYIARLGAILTQLDDTDVIALFEYTVKLHMSALDAQLTVSKLVSAIRGTKVKHARKSKRK